MIKIFNSGVTPSQSEYINHRLSTFLRIEIAEDGDNRRISVFQDGVSQLDVLYITSVAQELTDFNASVANIAAATV